ncbi:WRKY transcription factor 1, partial [Mucuna pruriens]
MKAQKGIFCVRCQRCSIGLTPIASFHPNPQQQQHRHLTPSSVLLQQTHFNSLFLFSNFEAFLSLFRIEAHMVSSDKNADQNIPSDKLQQRASPDSDITLSQGHDTKNDLSKPEGATSIPSVVAKNEEGKDSDATACALESDQEGSTCSLPVEKHLQSPDTLPHELPPSQSSQESPSIIREKVSKDGYNWRKYGQKHVKGNEFIRSYYKCTHPNCQAKKQLQQSNNGHITDSICIGQHNHPRPQLNSTVSVECVLPVVEHASHKPSLANVEDKISVEHGRMPQQIKPLHCLPTTKVSPVNELKAAHLLQLNKAKNHVHDTEGPESKRLYLTFTAKLIPSRKKDNSNADATGVDMSTSESRVVVQTSSEVDLVNDGYRWRKYGQKLVKGNTNPRSYYRCSNPGCPVKKHVERASHDSKIVITTYEGQHDHEIPPGRTVTQNAAINTHTTATNGKAGTKSGGNTVCVDTGERSGLDSASRLTEQLNDESITKSKAGDMVEFSVISLSNEGPEIKLSEQQQQKDNSGTKDDSVSNDIICHSSSGVLCRSNEPLKGEVETISEGSKDCLNVVGVRDTPSTQITRIFGPFSAELNKEKDLQAREDLPEKSSIFFMSRKDTRIFRQIGPPEQRSHRHKPLEYADPGPMKGLIVQS